jgi:hypothetical protein
MVRDGAALGLAALRDKKALASLKAAVDREPYPRLRRDLENSLRQLDNTAA